MPKVKKRVNNGNDAIRRTRPEKPRPDQVGMLLNHEDEADESEIDPGHTESQEFLALTRKRVAARSNEVLGTFGKMLESRKATALGMLGSHAKAINAKDVVLREATITILGAVSPTDAPTHVTQQGRQHSALTLSKPLKEVSESCISISKAFLQQYRTFSLELIAPKDQPHTSRAIENIEYLQGLLDKRRERLRREIHAILSNEDLTGEAHHEDRIENELWDRFAADSSALKPVDHDWQQSGAWTESAKNSTKALRRLVKVLPN